MFKRISDEDVNYMGFSPLFSRPDWMICQVFAVPPPAVRPSVKHDVNNEVKMILVIFFVILLKQIKHSRKNTTKCT